MYNRPLSSLSAKNISNKPMKYAKVAELVDALDLGSSAVRRESSSLSFRTTYKQIQIHDEHSPTHDGES